MESWVSLMQGFASQKMVQGLAGQPRAACVPQTLLMYILVLVSITRIIIQTTSTEFSFSFFCVNDYLISKILCCNINSCRNFESFCTFRSHKEARDSATRPWGSSDSFYVEYKWQLNPSGHESSAKCPLGYSCSWTRTWPGVWHWHPLGQLLYC